LSEARPVPLSASVHVSREALTQLLGEIRELLPDELRQARWVLRERESLLEEAEQTAQRIIADARQECVRLAGETEVMRTAEREAKRVERESTEQARTIKLEAEDYIDGQLARFELILTRTLKSVGAGRDRLRADGEDMSIDLTGNDQALFDHERA
jgi:hypothetical protein